MLLVRWRLACPAAPRSRATRPRPARQRTISVLAPSVSGLDAEAAYDIWLNDLNKEVMVWVDNHGQTPAGSKVAAYSVSGATWDLYVTSDNSYMAFVREGNADSGSVDLFTLLKDLEGRGLLSSSDTLWQVNFGFEISSTGGRQASFSVTNYSLNSTPSS
jgi:hypothetical protein